MKIGIVGLGLIGGSLAMSIRKHTEHTVFGYDIDPLILFLIFSISSSLE